MPQNCTLKWLNGKFYLRHILPQISLIPMSKITILQKAHCQNLHLCTSRVYYATFTSCMCVYIYDETVEFSHPKFPLNLVSLYSAKYHVSVILSTMCFNC